MLISSNAIKSTEGLVIMKPLFAIDVTKNKKNGQQNGEEFLVRAVTEAELTKDKKTAVRVAPEEKKTSLLVKILKPVTCLAGFGIAALTVYESITSGFTAVYGGNPIRFWVGAGLVVFWALLSIFTLGQYRDPDLLGKADRKKKTVLDAVGGLYSELGVPEDADEVDVFSFRYKVKKGENEIVVPRTQYTDYLNVSVRMYVKDGKLCLADLANVYAIDLISLKRIITVEKTATFPYWNKQEKHNDSLYSPFKVSYRHGIFKVKPYYLLLIEKDQKDYGIYFPSYELSKFERLTEITADK